MATTAPTIRDILGDEDLALLFREFLHQLQCAENLSFYVEVEDYKRLPSSSERAERGEKVWNKYFGKEASTPLNVDSKCRQRIESIVSTGDIDVFDEASEFAYSLLSFDCYRKFITSETYNAWLGTPSSLSFDSLHLDYRSLSIELHCVIDFEGIYDDQDCTNPETLSESKFRRLVLFMGAFWTWLLQETLRRSPNGTSCSSRRNLWRKPRPFRRQRACCCSKSTSP